MASKRARVGHQIAVGEHAGCCRVGLVELLSDERVRAAVTPHDDEAVAPLPASAHAGSNATAGLACRWATAGKRAGGPPRHCCTIVRRARGRPSRTPLPTVTEDEEDKRERGEGECVEG
jgi:hypothetical protein